MGNKRDQNQPESSDKSWQGSSSLPLAREIGTHHDLLAEGLSAGTSFRCPPRSQFWNNETEAISRPNRAVISVQGQDSDSEMRHSSPPSRQEPHGISLSLGRLGIPRDAANTTPSRWDRFRLEHVLPNLDRDRIG
ncbi:hypothetical protein T11_17990 [Trichinella zimbabwensis]|uniref:Uncharacterized protein n=1 Tax=Trichinella zimbabwensis TaxID=268475 RepID=A0A0V1H3V7_9BILA|nr:hypothetical protein T11_17990 [Trichinella zimbabwensis]